MNYFLKGLFSGNTKYFIYVGVLALGYVAYIDSMSGAYKGKVAIVYYIIIFSGLFGTVLFHYLKEKRKEAQTREMELNASLFEPQREKEIRELLLTYPDFKTHCYECIHFNSTLKSCEKQISQSISYKRLKEVKINDKSYCLYWETGIWSDDNPSN